MGLLAREGLYVFTSFFRHYYSTENSASNGTNRAYNDKNASQAANCKQSHRMTSDYKLVSRTDQSKHVYPAVETGRQIVPT